MKRSSQLFWFGIVLVFVFVISVAVFFSSLGENELNLGPMRATHWSLFGKEVIEGNGRMARISESVPKLNKISIGGDFKVIVKSGDKDQVSIVTDSNIQEHLKWSVKNGEIEIKSDDAFNLSPKKPIEVEITASDLRKIDLGGRTDLSALNLTASSLEVSLGGNNRANISGNIADFQINMAGRSSLKLNLTQGELAKIKNAGKGEIALEGRVKNLEIHNAGAAVVNGKNITAQNVKISGAGRTRITVRAADSVTLNAVGDSVLHYYGNPKIINNGTGKTEISKEGGES